MKMNELNKRMAKKMGVLLLTAAVTGGSVGQSVYAATGVSKNRMEQTVQNKNQRIQKVASEIGGSLPDRNGRVSGVKWKLDLETGEFNLTGTGTPYITGAANNPLGWLPWGNYIDNIRSITIDKEVNLENIDYWFWGSRSLETAPQLPDGVQSAEETFAYCKKLHKSAKLPDSLQNCRKMFIETALKEAPEPPKSLENGYGMFEDCLNLNKINGDLPDNENMNVDKMYACALGTATRIWSSAKNMYKYEKKAKEFLLKRILTKYSKLYFQDGDGQILKEVHIDEGTLMNFAQVPKAPKGCYWNEQDLEKIKAAITGDVLIRAEKEEFTVVFKDWDGRILNTQKVKNGEKASLPSAPSRTGYTFTGWDRSFYAITGDMTITAQYKKNADTSKPNATSPQTVVKPSISVTKKQTMANKGFQIKVYKRIKGASVNFKTSNKKIASVSKAGYVKGVNAGKATITTTVKQNGKTYSFKTTVTVKAYVKFLKVKRTIKKGKSYTFKAKAYGVSSKLKWSVSNKKIGKISSKGKFKAKKKGKVYITVRSGKYKAKYLVKIK